MKAQEIKASVTVLGTSYPVQSIRLSKSIGHLTIGSASIQMQQSSKAQPVSGDEVASLARAFNNAVLNKTDATPNVEVNLVDQINFSGILLGCNGSIDAKGSASFSINFAEPAYMLNAMNLSCYPSGVPQSKILSKVEVKHPFADLSQATGPISLRIAQLYRTALSNFKTTGTYVDRIFEQQRQINTGLASVFGGVIQRSNANTNAEWLENDNAVLSAHLNDVLATTLFSSSLNLWQALMNIANQTNLIYVGDFERGGYFRQLELEGGGGNLAAPPISTRALSLGRSGEQAIGQVSAYAPERDAYHGEFNYRSGSTDKSRILLSAYPDTPLPANGKIITMEAPSWFVIGRETAVRDIGRNKMNGKTGAEVDLVLADMKKPNEELTVNKETVKDQLRLWCRDKYNLLRARNISASIRRPFTTNELELGTPGDVAEGVSGILNGVTHDVAINGNSGAAYTTYDVRYVGATTG